MKKGLVVVGQVAVGVIAGCVASDLANKVVDVVKKAVVKKKGKVS